MTIHKSVLMLTNTGNKYDVIGEPVRADNWFGYTDGIHTISVAYNHFHGNFHIQGTLSTSPSENDWFDIDINSENTGKPYIVYNGETGINAFTFVGNFTFLRAVVNRSNRGELVPDINGNAIGFHGNVDKVILAM